MHDSSLLSRLGLLPDVSIDLIKSRFRELVKKYHPDTGGEGSVFIELVEIYIKLTGVD